MMKKAGFLLLSNLVVSLNLLVSPAYAADSEQQIFTKARALFAEKQFPQALELYNQIPTKSDRYLLAVEEKAWAYMHLDEYDKAIAEAQTLTSPSLSGLTSTEPFLLKAIIQLKICDYVAVFKTLKEFKIQKRGQVEAIQQLAKTGANTVSRATLEKWMLDAANWKAIGPQLSSMPQLFFRDVVMLREAQKKNLPAMEKRLKELATIENNENFRILQKLNLVEVESVQRVHVLSQFDRKQGEKVEMGAYDMTFKDDKEIWLDEIDSYQATVNRCQKKSGRTM